MNIGIQWICCAFMGAMFSLTLGISYRIDHHNAVQARVAAALEKIADGLQRSTEARQTQPERPAGE